MTTFHYAVFYENGLNNSHMTDKQYIPNKVTVVIPAYNEERFLRDALDSVVAQVDCVVIGDNASTDDTEKICREYAEKYPHIKYFRHEKNLGSLGNQKFLLRKVDTEFCFQMGAHDMVPPDYIAKLRAVFQQNPEAIAVYADCHKIDEKNQTYKHVCYGNVYDNNTKQTFPQLLTSEIPQQRIVAFLLNVNYTYLIFGLYRTKIAQQSWDSLSPVAGCDEVALYGAAFAGKFVYCRDTSFLLRLVHPTDSCKKYMERIVGDAGQKQSVVPPNNKRDYSPCVASIREMFVRLPVPNGFEKEAEHIFRRFCYRFATKAEVYSGFAWIDFYLFCKKTRKFFFDIKLNRNKKYVKLFGVVLYDRSM